MKGEQEEMQERKHRDAQALLPIHYWWWTPCARCCTQSKELGDGTQQVNKITRVR